MTIEEYSYDLSPTDDHLRELGRIIAESAILESVIAISIWQILKLPWWVGEQLTTAPNLGQLANTLFALIPKVYQSEDDQKEFEPIATELKAVVSLRNHVAHCYWTFGSTRDRPLSLNYRNEKGEIAARSKPWSPEELYRIAARISRVGDELEWFIRAHGGGDPLPQTRDWRRYQVPPEPKWPPVGERALQARHQSSPPKPQGV